MHNVYYLRNNVKTKTRKEEKPKSWLNKTQLRNVFNSTRALEVSTQGGKVHCAACDGSNSVNNTQKTGL